MCEALDRGNSSEATEIARREYPFSPHQKQARRYTEFQAMQIFLRDGFVDRYTGSRLVFPPVLRLLGQLLPNEFPAHPNWKMSESHIVYWELFPTIDHVVPVARGGEDKAENWVCTSMRCNQAKLNWTLEELGWTLHPRGTTSEWDGLTAWFLRYAERNTAALETPYSKRWHSAAIRVRRDAQGVPGIPGT